MAKACATLQGAALVVAIAMPTALRANASTAETTLAIVATRSHARFDVRHLYVEHVTGTVPIVRGSVAFASGSSLPTRVEATLDPKHIDTHDGDRDDDLKGPDWFDVAKFPTWTFAGSIVTPQGNGSFAVAGTLTVHGVAVPVTLDVTTVRGLPHPAYRATAKLDRHAFGMRLTPLDGTIGNELDLTLDVELE